MRQAVAAAGIPNGRVRFEAECGEPAMRIVARALALRADTIVLGTILSKLARTTGRMQPWSDSSVASSSCRTSQNLLCRGIELTLTVRV